MRKPKTTMAQEIYGGCNALAAIQFPNEHILTEWLDAETADLRKAYDDIAGRKTDPRYYLRENPTYTLTHDRQRDKCEAKLNALHEEWEQLEARRALYARIREIVRPLGLLRVLAKGLLEQLPDHFVELPQTPEREPGPSPAEAIAVARRRGDLVRMNAERVKLGFEPLTELPAEMKVL